MAYDGWFVPMVLESAQGWDCTGGSCFNPYGSCAQLGVWDNLKDITIKFDRTTVKIPPRAYAYTADTQTQPSCYVSVSSGSTQ